MKFILRRARKEDLEFLFNLRNDEAIRRSSFNSDPISLETHQNWLEKKLLGSDSVLLIAEENSQPIAQVRFDWLNNNETEINIGVTENFRGRGYGSEILKKSSLQFFQEFPNCNKIYAFIKLDNPASVRSFSKAGYQLIGETEYKGRKCVEMIWKRQ